MSSRTSLSVFQTGAASSARLSRRKPCADLALISVNGTTGRALTERTVTRSKRVERRDFIILAKSEVVGRVRKERGSKGGG
jgi:hypothetical protein